MLGPGGAKRVGVHSATRAIAVLVPGLVVHREGDAWDGGASFGTLRTLHRTTIALLRG